MADAPPGPGPLVPQESWACSDNLGISIIHPNASKTSVTSGPKDFKPSWSTNSPRLTFFRLISSSKGFHSWRTKIAVVNADGTKLKLLTKGNYPDFNPTWPRDGGNYILFNRYSPTGAIKNRIYTISPDGAPGDEVLISDPGQDFEWAATTLKDGRVFVDRQKAGKFTSHLLTPKPKAIGTYQQIKRPTTLKWHKLSISPNETRVTYMLDNDGSTGSYKDVVIAIADFDVAKLEIKNQKIITPYDMSYIVEYPRWSSDGKHVIYDSNKSGKYQVYAYRLADGKTTNMSPSKTRNFQFAGVKNLPK